MFNCYIKSLLLFALLLVVIACSHFQSIIEALDHRYFVREPDAYMHLVIAFDLLNHHDWYQHFNDRINAPFGADTHAWTNVISAILVGGVWFISFFKPSGTALYLWGFVVPIIINAVAAVALLWSIRPLKPTPYQQLFILAAFLFNPFVNDYFIPLRVDYDFLLLTLAIIYWGHFLRLLLTKEQRWVVFSALTAALGLWTSISFVILMFVSLAFILSRGHDYLRTTIRFLGALVVALAFIIPLEHHRFFTVAYDIVSIVYLVFFLLLLLSLMLYEQYSRVNKVIFIIGLMLFNAFLMNYFFPGFYLGPYNHVDPYLLQHFFPVLSEFYSPFSIDNALTLALLCYFIVGIGYCYFLYLDDKLTLFSADKKQHFSIEFIVWIAIVMTALTLYMYRWNEFAIPVDILLVSFFVAHLCNISANKLGNLCLVFAIAMMPAAIVLLSKNDLAPVKKKCQKQFHEMIHDGFLDKPSFRHDKIMLADSNDGPLILYATHFSVIATNDHHNPQGIKDSFNFFYENEIIAKNRMMHRKIDLVLLCKAKLPKGFDIDTRQWLQRVSLPGAYSYWRLYRTTY